MHCQLMVVIHSHRPRIHGSCVHHGLLPSVNDLMSRIQDLLSRIHDLISRSHEGRGGALWLLVQCLQHLVHHLLLAGVLLSPQSNDLELIFHLLTTGLRAHGLAALESGFQCLNDRGNVIMSSLCYARCSGGVSATAAAATAAGAPLIGHIITIISRRN